MKYIKKFNENTEFDFKNDNEDITDFFHEYYDRDEKNISIEDGVVVDNKFKRDTSYVKNPTKTRKAKLVKVLLGDGTGISYDMKDSFTNLEILSNLLLDLKRFYTISKEEINYVINTDFMGMSVEFIVLGEFIKEDESKSDKIDKYLKEISEYIRGRGYKRQTINGNWLDVRFPKKDDYISGWKSMVYKISNGTTNLENCLPRETKLVEIRNSMLEHGLKISVSGGDQQLVIKLVKL